MCPNQGVEASLMPDFTITNRVIMYEMMHHWHAEEISSEDVDILLRDRYETFRQVMQNYPTPLNAPVEGSTLYTYVFDALHQQREQLLQLSEENSSISIENNPSVSSASLSSIVSSLSVRCDNYEDIVRNALTYLSGGNGETEQNLAIKEDSNDEAN